MGQVTFYVGRAGAGKTYQLHTRLMEARNAGRAAALIVPEQFTYEAERALCARLGGLLGVQVLSISRMRERVVATKDRPFLSEEGRRMVIRRVAYRTKSKLKLYKEVSGRSGFAASMSEMFARFKQAMITPEALQEAANNLPEGDLLALKLHDMAVLYEGMQAYLDENYLDTEDALRALIDFLPHSPLCGADICFDGFGRVNEQTYAILTALMRVCRTLSISICMDPDEQAPDYALFAPERHVFERLYETAYSLGLSPSVRHVSFGETHKTPALRHLARQLYAYPPKEYTGEAKEIIIAGARSTVEEVERLADEVALCARSGIRYRDMVVIASDMQAYASAVQRAFTLRDIPLFMDARRGMLGYPMVELVLCAVRAAGTRLYRPDLLRILKSGLAGVEAEDVEAFENYCLRRGLMFDKSFLSPFPEEEEAAERARALLIPPLMELREGLQAPDAGTKTRAVYAYLERLDVQRQLAEEVDMLREEERFALMEEHAQVWDIFMELLLQLHGILGGAAMSAREYTEVLQEAVSSYQVGIIPATADQVLFGDVERTRSREVRALFLLGCNEGHMPPPQADQDMIDDAELTRLKDLGLHGWSSSGERAAGDHLALYRAITQATERVYFGFAYASGTSERMPAQLIERVRTMFQDHTERDFTEETLPHTARSGFALLARGLFREEPLYEALRAYYREDDHFKDRLLRMEEFAASPATQKALGPATAKKLYGGVYYGSVSRLTTYRRCPYLHFLQYGLNAKPRREYKEKKTDIGTFSHMALEKFVRRVQELPGGFLSLTTEATNALMDEIFPVCLEEYENGLLIGSARARVLSVFWMDAVRATAHAVVKSSCAGTFLPVETELKFGVGGDIPPLRLPVGGTHMLLSGSIDRVDAAMNAAGEKRIRVVDYKTGATKLDYTNLYDGSTLQLPLYLLAALREGAEPSGIYYQPVKTAVEDEEKPGAAEDKLRLQGLLLADDENIHATEQALSGKSAAVQSLARNADGSLRKSSPVLKDDELRALLRHAVKKAGQIAQELMQGKIEAYPVEKACQYCDYQSVCRFDTKLKTCRRRPVQKMDKAAFFAATEGGDGE